MALLNKNVKKAERFPSRCVICCVLSGLAAVHQGVPVAPRIALNRIRARVSLSAEGMQGSEMKLLIS